MITLYNIFNNTYEKRLHSDLGRSCYYDIQMTIGWDWNPTKHIHLILKLLQTDKNKEGVAEGREDKNIHKKSVGNLPDIRISEYRENIEKHFNISLIKLFTLTLFHQRPDVQAHFYWTHCILLHKHLSWMSKCQAKLSSLNSSLRATPHRCLKQS